MTTAAFSLIFSFVATAVAVFAFARALSRQLPTVEFLVERDESEQALYKLGVSNPTHRLLVLDHVRVLKPRPEEVWVRRMDDSLRGDLERAYEDASIVSKQTKSVFLAIPAEKTRYLEVQFSDEEGFEVSFQLYWSKGLPLLERWFIPRNVKLDWAQVKSRKLAAVGRTA